MPPWIQSGVKKGTIVHAILEFLTIFGQFAVWCTLQSWINPCRATVIHFWNTYQHKFVIGAILIISKTKSGYVYSGPKSLKVVSPWKSIGITKNFKKAKLVTLQMWTF